MKKTALVSALLVTATSSVYANESMTSLSYRVAGGEIHVGTGLSFEKTKSTDPSDNSKNELKLSVWDFDFTYGVTNELSFGVGFGVPVSTDLTVDGEDAHFKMKGLSDVALKGSYRYLDTDLKADLLFGLNVSGTKKIKTTANGFENDYQTGGHSLEVGSRVAGHMNAFEWSGLVNVKHSLEAKSDDGAIDKTKARTDFKLGFAGQYNFMSTMALGLDATANFNGKEESKTDGTGTKAFTEMMIGMNYKYQMAKDFMLGLRYQTTLEHDLKDLDGNVDEKDVKENAYSFSVSYRF